MAHTVLRSTGDAIVVSMLLAVGSSRLAWAATIDCETITATSAAGVLGVRMAKSIPLEGHHKQSPDNMDVFACGYAEASADPMARTLSYVVYTPIPRPKSRIPCTRVVRRSTTPSGS